MSARSFYYTWDYQPKEELFQVAGGEHDEFVLQDGRRVYDFLSTSFQTSFGHSNPVIREAIHRQLDLMPIASPKSTFQLKQRVTERLCEFIGLPNGRVFYTVSGSESVENALKMARQITGRTKVLARKRSYHGATLGALSVTGDWRNEPHFTLDSQTIRIPEPDADAQLHETKRVITDVGADQFAALIVETISGANGVVIPDQQWFDEIAVVCRENGILLIVDEVLCGFGRTGPAFAFHNYNLEPDLVCMSKGITGGYVPFGAVWTGPRIVEYYDTEKLSCGLTNYAHPLGLAALQAVLNLLTDASFKANKLQLEKTFAKALEEFRSLTVVSDVRCRGLLAAIDLKGQEPPSWQAMFEAGLHAYSKEQRVILSPPFISTPARLTEAVRTLRELLVRPVNTTAIQ